jgi:hypothetical protein
VVRELPQVKIRFSLLDLILRWDFLVLRDEWDRDGRWVWTVHFLDCNRFDVLLCQVAGWAVKHFFDLRRHGV